MKKIIIAMLFIVVIFGGMVVYYQNEPQIVYVKEIVPIPTLNDIIVERTSNIMASSTFQEEVRALATARAMYQLSIEKQDVAVDLSEMALASYLKSKALSDNWRIQ